MPLLWFGDSSVAHLRGWRQRGWVWRNEWAALQGKHTRGPVEILCVSALRGTHACARFVYPPHSTVHSRFQDLEQGLRHNPWAQQRI